MLNRIAIAPLLGGDEINYEIDFYDKEGNLLGTIVSNEYSTFYHDGQLYFNTSIPIDELMFYNLD